MKIIKNTAFAIIDLYLVLNILGLCLCLIRLFCMFYVLFLIEHIFYMEII